MFGTFTSNTVRLINICLSHWRVKTTEILYNIQKKVFVCWFYLCLFVGSVFDSTKMISLEIKIYLNFKATFSNCYVCVFFSTSVIPIQEIVLFFNIVYAYTGNCFVFLTSFMPIQETVLFFNIVYAYTGNDIASQCNCTSVFSRYMYFLLYNAASPILLQEFCFIKNKPIPHTPPLNFCSY